MSNLASTASPGPFSAPGPCGAIPVVGWIIPNDSGRDNSPQERERPLSNEPPGHTRRLVGLGTGVNGLHCAATHTQRSGRPALRACLPCLPYVLQRRRGPKEPVADGGMTDGVICLPACQLPGYSRPWLGDCFPASARAGRRISPTSAREPRYRTKCWKVPEPLSPHVGIMRLCYPCRAGLRPDPDAHSVGGHCDGVRPS